MTDGLIDWEFYVYGDPYKEQSRDEATRAGGSGCMYI